MSGGDVFALEYAVVRPTGEGRIISWYVTPLAEDGRPTGLLASGVDPKKSVEITPPALPASAPKD